MASDLITFCSLLLWLTMLGGPQGAASQSVLKYKDPNCTKTIKNKKGQTLCLWYVQEAKNWHDADADCALYGGYLLAVTSPEIQEIALEMMSNHSAFNLWLGVRESLTKWQWLETSEETFHQGCFEDDKDNRGSGDDYQFPDNNSYALCSDTCKTERQTYAGVKGRTNCWCSNNFGDLETSTACNILCPVSRTEVCGGDTSTNIMAVGGTYSNWEDGQPNNHQRYQACAVLDHYNTWQWNDVKCTEFQSALCEMKIDNTTCLSKGYFYDETWGCFTLTNYTMSFFSARYYCHQLNGQLLTLDSANKTMFYTEFLKETNYTQQAFFLGLSRSQWRWSNGDPLYFSSWGSSHPNGRDQPCASTDQEGKWNDVPCTATHSYICQRSNVARLPTTTPKPTTTPMPTTTAKPFVFCNTTCFPPWFGDDFGGIEKDILIYSLIGGGTLLGIILVVMAICTYNILVKHFRKKKEKRFDYFFGVDVSTHNSSSKNQSSTSPSGDEKTPTLNGSIHSTDKHPPSQTNGSVHSETKAPPSPNGIVVKADIVQETPQGSLKAEVLPPSPSASIVFTGALTPSEESLLMKDTSQEVILFPADLPAGKAKSGVDNNGFIMPDNGSLNHNNHDNEHDYVNTSVINETNNNSGSNDYVNVTNDDVKE